MSSGNDLTLGEYLRQEREKKGLTVEQVASATKISVRLLHSLEADQYSELPAKPFIRGFVTSYARFVGLDPREVLTQFGDFIEAKSHDRPSREGGHSGYAFEKREGEQGSRTALGITMGVFLVFGAVAYLVLKPSLKHHHGSHADKLRAVHAQPSTEPSLGAVEMIGAAPSPTPSPLPSPSPTQEKTAVVSKPSPSPKPAATPNETPSPASTSSVPDPLNSGVGLKPSETKYRLVLKAKESTWVRYQCDTRKEMQFVLRKDRVLVLRAQGTIKLQIANPADVTMSVNNGGYKVPAEGKDYVLRQNDATLFFPSELAESTQEPFPGQKPLSTRSVPVPRTPAPSPSPGA